MCRQPPTDQHVHQNDVWLLATSESYLELMAVRGVNALITYNCGYIARQRPIRQFSLWKKRGWGGGGGGGVGGGSGGESKSGIQKTSLYNFDPLKPHFYIVKLGFTGVYIIFLISAQNKSTLRTASARRFKRVPTIYAFQQKYEKYQNFFLKIFIFGW